MPAGQAPPCLSLFIFRPLSFPSPTHACCRTSILPRRSRVAWELWTNSNDECGASCNEQIQFIQVWLLLG